MAAPVTDGEFRILTPNAMLGYGYDVDQFWYGIEKYKPLAIIVEAAPRMAGLTSRAWGR